MTQSITAKDKRIVSEQAGTISRTSGASRDQVVSITDLISEGEIEGLVLGEASVYLNDDNVVEPSQSSIPSTYLKTAVLSATNGSQEATVNINLPIEFLNNPDYRVMYIYNAYASSVTVGAVATNPRAELTIPIIPLTTPTAFFDATTMNWANSVGVSNAATLSITSSGESISGRLDVTSTTTARFTPSISDPNIANRFVAAAQGEATTISVIGTAVIDDVTDLPNGETQLTLNQPFSYPTGNYSIAIGAPRTTAAQVLGNANFGKFRGITVQERRGKVYQPVITNFGDISGTGLTSTTFQAQALEYNDDSSENPTTPPEKPVVISATSSSATGLGLSPSQVREVDEVRLLFTYAAFKSNKSESGAEEGAGARTKIELTIFRGTEESTVTLVSNRNHSGNTTSPISFEERINLEPFKPFSDFKITVTRLTRQDGRGVMQDGTNRKTEWKVTAPGSITSVTSIIKENLSYPYSAYVNVTFSSEEFQSVPTRTYHARGLKVRVPSNYTTREENGTNTATYSGLWDGSLDKIVYTDNPAWIFYDILSNNRYGLGEWISVNDIDKYSLYRIAKYCDELVPDGKGGQEPRFRSNIYLTKSADAYKVLKDIASSFLSMLYWMDGQIVTVIDQPKDPIYTFSKANVIDGAFSYETTGSKTRANQIIVSWNNPVNNYILEPLIVEDRENIVQTGRIITEDASAFGCTSEGQALRYGRWKLWTAVNQTRLVSFKTSINAAFLVPGDVIKIQDADEYNIAYSGRVSNSGIIDTNTIPLDRTVTLNAGSTYYLSVLLEKPTVANEGEEEQRDTKVETIEVTSTGTVSSLELASAFSSIPPRSSVWVLREETPLGFSKTSAKDYKILAITEDERNSFSIVAVEHYNEKFDAVDGEFSLVVEEGVEPNYTALDTPPAPPNLYIQDAPDFNKAGNEFRLTWDSPKNLDGSLYSFVSGFEISHNVPGYSNPLIVSASAFAFLFENVEENTYSIAVRTLNSTGKKSNATTITFSAENQFEDNIPRGAGGIPTSGATSTPLIIDQLGLLRFKEEPFSFIFPQDQGQPTNFASANKINTYNTALVLNTGYDVTFNHNGVLAVLGKETSGGLILWYDPLDVSSEWSYVARVLNPFKEYARGRSSVVTNKILAAQNFPTLEAGQLVKLERVEVQSGDPVVGETPQYVKITSVELDNSTGFNLYTLDRSLDPTGFFDMYESGAKEYVDPTLSTFVGKLTRTGDSSSTFVPLIAPDPLQVDLPPTTARLSSSDYKIVYDESSVNPTYIDETGTETTGEGNILLTANALNIDTPLYRFTLEGQVQPWTESPTVSVPVPQTFFNNAKVYKVEVAKKPTGWAGDGVVADPYVAASYDEISITPTTKLGYTPYNVSNPANYATETYVNTAVSNLVDSAPATLDTLNELAAALGDDENFATTVTNSLALKAPIDSPSFTGNVTVAGLVDGRDIAVDGTKLDGIEAGATGDQTAAEIRALVESATDSNVFTDADHSKLDGIEANATADQTAAEIRALVESATDSNVFTDADHSKLDGIEAGATADQTAAEIRALVESATDSNVFTDADHSKLNGIEAGATADQTAEEIRTLLGSATDSNVFTDADHSKLDGIEAGATADQTAAEIRALVESATDSNVFTDADHSKLDGIEALADVTDTANVTAAGALMDSELANIVAVKALNQGVATTDSPTFAGLTVLDGITLDGITTVGTIAEKTSLPVSGPAFTKIQASDLQADDQFGQSVSISSDGNTAIVGSRLEDTGGTSAGAAYIFTRSGLSWTQQAKIQASDLQANDRFGSSVSISSDGNTAIVGANTEDTGGTDAGAAYIFTRSGTSWSQQAKIQASDKEEGDQFGNSVSISSDGNTAIVGAIYESTGGFVAGAAYIFVRSGLSWTQQAKIVSSDVEAVDFFGSSVSISSDGNTAIVGAYAEGATDAGAAYIFTRSGTSWSQQAKIQAIDAEANDFFGISVSISSDGNTAIVSAYGENTGGTGAGAAYIFIRSGTSWTQQAKIQAADAEAGDYFGNEVSMSSDGNTALVGAAEAEGNTGAVYIFKKSGSIWTEAQKIQAGDAEAGDYFGSSVSISSDGLTAIVGARNEDTGATNAGATYIFEVEVPSTIVWHHNISQSSIFSHSNLTENITVNFFNVPTTNDRTIEIELAIEQGATGYLPTAIQINSAAQTFVWENGVTPDASINAFDVVKFTLLRSDDTWTVFASLTRFTDATYPARITLTDISVGAEAAASGDGGITYNNTTGVFTYTPPDIRALVESATDSNVFTDADHSKLDGIEALADVTDTANVTAAGALMDSELTNIAAVKALNQGVATTDSPSFAGLTLSGIPIAPTATAGTSTTQIATTEFTTTAIANLVDSAPATLDTLNELAAALGDDPNFATTVSNSIGTKWTQDNTKITNWDTAYSWGDHAVAGYVTSVSVDGGSAGSVYLPVQSVDGGNA